jgi:2-alkyl-3-oxoalkanoate reductase
MLTFGKVREIFHPDWSVHDRRLAGSLDFHAHYDLRHGFADTIDWYRRHKWI